MKSSIFLSLVLISTIYAQNVELDTVDVTAEAQSEEEVLQDSVKKETTSLAKEAKGETLGDYLENEQFVDSASYGPAVGRPVVRGMDGYRVGVTSGNVTLNDLSAMSQDHAVGIMARASENIELIKGPSSLLYGNYSGGVIRVSGEEHNKELLKHGYSLDTTSSYGTNGAGLTLGATLKASDNNLSISANGVYHDANSYNNGSNNTVKDSYTLSEQSHVVLGYQPDKNNVIKLYGDILHKDYGIPNSTPESTTIVMDQIQGGLIWHAEDLFSGLEHMQTEIDYSDYLHSEYEGNSADGLFGQTQFTIANSIDALVGEWEIKTNAQYQNTELQVCHDHGHCQNFSIAERTSNTDGFDLQKNIDKYGMPYAHGHPMPNTYEQKVSLGGSVAKYIDDDNEFTISLRSEFRQLEPNSENIQETWLVTDSIDPHYYDTINDIALSTSIGLNGYITDDLAFNSSLSYIERLPSASELFWNGFHHATNSYIFGDRYVGKEKSINADLDLLYTANSFTTKGSIFYYNFFNYIYQDPLMDANNTQVTDPFHHSDVWQIKGVAAKLYGIALEESYKTKLGANRYELRVNGQAIRAQLKSGGNLPRIPTFNAGVTLEHSHKGYRANVSYKYIDKNRFKADNETNTPAYRWISALISYNDKTRYFEYDVYLKGENLTNEIAYNNLSFLKETAPLAGRQISLGLDLHF